MKKLIVTMMLAGSMLAVADEAAKPAVATAPAKVTAPARKQMTPEQRAEMRAKFEQRMAARKAEMEKKAVEIIKKYGLDDEKAKALYDELQNEMRSGFGRRSRPNMKRPAKTVAPATAPAKAE